MSFHDAFNSTFIVKTRENAVECSLRKYFITLRIRGRSQTTFTRRGWVSSPKCLLTFCKCLQGRKCHRRGLCVQKTQKPVNVVCERPLKAN